MVKRYILICILHAFCMFTANSQVTIGTVEGSVIGALLQVKNLSGVINDDVNANKGLVMPRVQLTSLTNLFPMFQADGVNYKIGEIQYTKASEDSKHTGLVVYNMSTTSPFEKGLYTWNGTKWITMGGSSPWLDFTNSLAANSSTDHIYKSGQRVSVVAQDNVIEKDSAVIFDVTASNQGILLPQVELKNETDKMSIKGNHPPVGLLVYNTGGNSDFPISGFMFWNGVKWRLLSDATTEKPQISNLIDESQVLLKNSYIAGTDFEDYLEVGYSGGNGSYYSKGLAYKAYSSGTNEIWLELQPGKLEGTGKLTYKVYGKSGVSSPTAIDDVNIRFFTQDLGNIRIGGKDFIQSVQYTLFQSALTIQPGLNNTATGSKPLNGIENGCVGTSGTNGSGTIQEEFRWFKNLPKPSTPEIIKLPETGAYVFSFRFYGTSNGTTSAASPYYLSAYKQIGASPKLRRSGTSDLSDDVLLDIAEMTIGRSTGYRNCTYSINLTVSGKAGDVIYFTIATISGSIGWQPLGGPLTGSFPANRTSMIYWKL